MKIQKFGGSNFISKQIFENFVKILLNTDGNTLVVVSALGKTTRRLLESAKLAENGNLTEAINITEKLKQFTLNLVDSIFEAEEYKSACLNNLNNLFEQVGKYLKNISILKELTPKVSDSLLSFGERISLSVFENFCLSKKIKFISVDAGEIIITDDNFTSANPLPDLIKENIANKILPLFKDNSVILTQGFIGKTVKGEYSTMGFESSNLTALLFAKCLSAKEITIWTDVEGVYNIDPNIWQKAKQLSELSFFEAIKAAKYGNKLFYPKMIEEASLLNMEITFRSVHNPAGKFTRISAGTNQRDKMVNILEEVSFFKMNLNVLDEPSGKIFKKLTVKNDSFRYVSRFNDFAEVFTNDKDIEAILDNSEIPFEKHICLTLINENILNLYKLIGEYSDLFLNLDYKLYPVDESIYFLFIKNQKSRDLTDILNVVI